MRLAKQHIPLVNAAISGDPRFRFIRFQEYTGGRGSLGVFGYVQAREDLEALRRRVQSSSPFVPVSWHVDVTATRSTTQTSS